MGVKGQGTGELLISEAEMEAASKANISSLSKEIRANDFLH